MSLKFTCILFVIKRLKKLSDQCSINRADQNLKTCNCSTHGLKVTVRYPKKCNLPEGSPLVTTSVEFRFQNLE